MIINKRVEEVQGYVTFNYEPKENFGRMFDTVTEDDLEAMFETKRFNNLKELLMLTDSNSKVIEEIKEDYNAGRVYVSHIGFTGKSEDNKTNVTLSYGLSTPTNGFISTEINNEDIDNRVLTNLKRIKEITDNALEQYPIAYRKQ
jgi:NurA-like 5'-3' nuclease